MGLSKESNWNESLHKAELNSLDTIQSIKHVNEEPNFQGCFSVLNKKRFFTSIDNFCEDSDRGFDETDEIDNLKEKDLINNTIYKGQMNLGRRTGKEIKDEGISFKQNKNKIRKEEMKSKIINRQKVDNMELEIEEMENLKKWNTVSKNVASQDAAVFLLQFWSISLFENYKSNICFGKRSPLAINNKGKRSSKEFFITKYGDVVDTVISSKTVSYLVLIQEFFSCLALKEWLKWILLILNHFIKSYTLSNARKDFMLQAVTHLADLILLDHDMSILYLENMAIHFDDHLQYQHSRYLRSFNGIQMMTNFSVIVKEDNQNGRVSNQNNVELILWTTKACSFIMTVTESVHDNDLNYGIAETGVTEQRNAEELIGKCGQINIFEDTNYDDNYVILEMNGEHTVASMQVFDYLASVHEDPFVVPEPD